MPPTIEEYENRGHTTPEQRQRFWKGSVGKGWQEKLVDPFLEVWRLAPPECEILQIKEKFAQLRIYVEGPEWWQNLADALEQAADKMCEACGRVDGTAYGMEDTTKVTVDTNGWWIRECQFCRQEREKEKADG